MSGDATERIVRRLAALGEARQRVAVVAQEADRLGMTAFADLVSAVLDRAREQRRDDDQIAAVAVMGYLDSELLDDQRRAALLIACRDGDHRALMRLLFAPTGRRAPKEGKVPDYGTGHPLTLGERKSLARKPSRRIVERVLADPDPAVIQNLLQNPKLTEADVVRLASKRPVPETVLTQVYTHPKWSLRYAVRLALARNPYTAPTLALKLLPRLMRQDLAEVAVDRLLHPSVLVAARRLLDGEGTGSESDGSATLH